MRSTSIWAKFAQAVIDARGEWVEIGVAEEEDQAAGYGTVYRHIGAQCAEVRKISGIMYGRMRES